MKSQLSVNQFFFAEKLNADLTVIHVNQPVLSQPKGMAIERINEETIRERITAYGFQKILNKINIIIESGESVSETINQHARDMDLICLLYTSPSPRDA